jgi:hypothetical protein
MQAREEEKRMFITLFAVIFAALLDFFIPLGSYLNTQMFSTIMLVSGLAIFIGVCLLYTLTLNPLARLDQKLIPNTMGLIRHNFLLHFGNLALFLFVFISLVSYPFMQLIQHPYIEHWFVLGWIIFFGFSLDLLRSEWNHFTNFLNPSYLVNQLSQKALHAVQNDDNEEVRMQLDHLTEVALQSVEKNKLGLGTQAVQTFPPIMHAFLGSAKSIGHSIQDVEKEKGKGRDESSYMNFYLIPRLEMIFDKALHSNVDAICRQIVMAMGKIILYCAQFDLSLVSFPVHFLTKFGLKAQQQQVDDVAVLTTSTLVETAKAILKDVDVTYAELQEPFHSIINGLDVLAKGTFKKRKDTNIKVLVQPLEDIKILFQTEKMAHHPDTPTILKEINGILDEYHVLAEVLSTLPPISDAEK